MPLILIRRVEPAVAAIVRRHGAPDAVAADVAARLTLANGHYLGRAGH